MNPQTVNALVIAIGVGGALVLSVVIFMGLRKAQHRQNLIFRERRERHQTQSRRDAEVDPSRINPDFVFDDRRESTEHPAA